MAPCVGFLCFYSVCFHLKSFIVCASSIYMDKVLNLFSMLLLSKLLLSKIIVFLDQRS